MRLLRKDRHIFFVILTKNSLMWALAHFNCSRWGVLGDGFSSLWDGVLGKLTWEEESDGSLDLTGWESVLSVVSNELGGLKGDLLEDIVDERVHDAHGSLGDSGLGVDLLEDSVDVDGESLVSSSLGSGLLGSSFCSLGCWGVLWWCHYDFNL